MIGIRTIVWTLLLACSSFSAFASSIGFDDIDASLGDVGLDVLSPYQGFTWTNFYAYTDNPFFTGFNNGIVSSSNAAYSGGEFFGATVTPLVGKIESAMPFDFVSAYLGAGYYDDLNLTVQGLLNGAVLFSTTVTVGVGGAQFFNFGYSGIDELNLFAQTTAVTSDPFLCGTFNCTQFTIDDLVIAAATSPPSSNIPEPGSLVLLGLGGVALGFARRRPFATRLKQQGNPFKAF